MYFNQFEYQLRLFYLLSLSHLSQIYATQPLINWDKGSPERAQHISWSHIISFELLIPSPELQHSQQTVVNIICLHMQWTIENMWAFHIQPDGTPFGNYY